MPGLASFALFASSILVATPAAAAPPASFEVTSTADAVDVSAGDGECTTVNNGGCSLRAAIMESNALPGINAISLGDRVHELQRAVVNEDTAETGDYDITDAVLIVGQGAGSVVDGGVPPASAGIEQTGLDRLFEIHPAAGDVRFENLTIRGAWTNDDGAGVLNWSSGTIVFDNVDLLRNNAGGAGGAIYNGAPRDYEWPLPDPSHEFIPSGRIEITNSRLVGNAAGAGGAAVHNSADGVVVITSESVVSDNPGAMVPNPQDPSEMIPAPGVFEPGAGAITNAGDHQEVGTIRIIDSEVNRNWATTDGAGIANEGDGAVVLQRSEVRGNTSLASGGGIFTHGGTVTLEDDTVVAENVAKDGAGIASDGASTTVGLRARLTLTESSVEANVAEGGGGGIEAGGNGYVVLTDVTVSGNKAGDAGGGMSVEDGASLEMLRTDVIANETHDEGGGGYLASSRPASIVDSLFEGNKAGTPEPPEPGQVFDPNSVNIAGGAGLYTENGALTISDSRFRENHATDEGGGISIDNFGDVRLTDVLVEDNRADTDGGGIENSGARVVFDHITVTDNRAGLDGGGIYNSSSGEFSILDSTISLNSGVSGGGLANAPDNKMHIKDSLFWRNTARTPPRGEDGLPTEGGHGGGIWSMADGDTDIENTTISGNVAATGGGGLFHDADGDIKMSNVTIWRNKAPLGGGIGLVESDFVPTVPPSPNVSIMLRNTIVGGSLDGRSCDYYVTSEGGNVASDGGCFISSPEIETGEGVRDRVGNPQLDAIADNGGSTLSHLPRYGSVAIDTASNPCPEFDQRGVRRPQNGKCDAGAVEFEGPAPLADTVDPESEYLTGPVQDSLETVAFTFTGSDLVTPADELQFECRLLEIELTEPPEPPAPWDPVDPELMWRQCVSPWSVPLVEEGLFNFEVRAIDKAGNVDETPDVYSFDGTDQEPPNTIIEQTPTNPSSSRSAAFTFTAIDSMTPPQFMEYECRLDTLDPDLWLECVNPALYSNLTTGTHTFEVRALDGNENMDPTPARYTWRVGQDPGAVNCDTANITLTAMRDTWVDEVNPELTHQFDTEVTVASGVDAGPPRVGENARALVKFPVPEDATNCELESAHLKLYAEGHTEPRTLVALPLAGPFTESGTNWMNQPDVRVQPDSGAAAPSGTGYRTFDVTDDVRAMMDGMANHGWSIRDRVENDPEGGDQAFASRELPQDPPEQTLPLLVLTYRADAAPTPPPPPEPVGPPTVVSCGMVINESIRVANDLDGPTKCQIGEGLVIGKPNIVVDLDGHTIAGPDYLLENATGQEEGFPAGIRNSGHDNVWIRNGTVKGFGYGVLLTPGTTRNKVYELEVYRNAMSGIELFDADDGRTGNTIHDNTIRDNELGISLLAGTQGARITDNIIGGNLGEQILVQYSSGNLLDGNDVDGIPSDPLLDSDGGILFEGSSDNTLRNGTVRDTGDAAVVINQGSNDNTVEGTVMWRNGDAGVIIIDSDGTTVDDVTAHQESDGGVVVNNGSGTTIRNSDLRYNPSGVEASNSNYLLVEYNDASESLATGFEIGNGVGIQIRDNIANRTGGDGIGMESGVFDTTGNPVGGAIIEGNTANENKGNGISVADGGHDVSDNDAHNNAGFGITIGEDPEVPGDPYLHTNTAPLLDDELVNRASNNGEITNCSGLECDESGNVLLTPPDTEAPDVEILSAPRSPSGTSVSFTFIGTDPGERTAATGLVYECRLDPGTDPLPEPEEPPTEPPEPGPTEVPEPPETLGWSECSSPVTFNGLENGDHRFEVRAHDQAEPPNEDLSPARHDWVVDVSASEEPEPTTGLEPQTRIAAGPAQGSTTESTTATFAYAGSDDHTPGMYLTFECSLDGADFTTCDTPNPRTYTVGVGAHTFAVQATDASGKTDPSPATRSWTVTAPPTDQIAPDTTMLTGPDHVTTLRTATFTFTSDDPTATRFECLLDQNPDIYPGAWPACSNQAGKSHTVTNLATGTGHSLWVRAVDPAGNRDLSPAGQSWYVGNAPTPGFVSCGQVITTSILVRNDLIDCLWDGLRVGANGITIDLDGHTIDGKGVAAAIRNDGFDNVTVKNGKVTDFDFGVMLNPGTQRNIIENMRVESNQEAGIGLGQVPHPVDATMPWPEPAPSSFQSNVLGNILRKNTVTANEVGIHLTNKTTDTFVFDNDLHANKDHGVFIERSTATKVEKNTITGSSGAGVELEGSNGNTVLENEITENGGGVRLGTTTTGTTGIPSNDNVVEKNTITDPVEAGIEILESLRNTIIVNTVRGSNGDGLEMYKAQDTLVKDNDFRTNLGGISLIGSSGNRLENNDASLSGGTGISLEALSVANVLLNNSSNDNDGDGIYVGDETSGGSGVWLEGNRTNGNKGYGIFVPKVAHTLKGNIANDNGGWGIWASDGSNGRTNIDAGGNKAQGNMGPEDPITKKPMQCFSVRCDGAATTQPDPIAPDTQLLETPGENRVDGNSNELQRFRFTGTDNSSTVTFQCSLDASSWEVCTSPKEYTRSQLGTAVGPHTFRVRAVDLAGNVDLSPATHTWRVGALVVPAAGVEITSAPDPATVKTTARFEFRTSGQASSLDCSLNGASWTPCTSPMTYSGLQVRDHTFTVRFVNSAGGMATDSHQWRVTAAPVDTSVSCAQVIVRSIRVTNDLINCPGNGLIVGAGGITIDLAGHTIDGTGLGTGIINNGFDQVTITNGTVYEFDYGVSLNAGTAQGIVDQLSLEANQEAGVALADADQAGVGSTVRRTTVIGNGIGIAVLSNTRAAVLSDNMLGANSGDGVLLESATLAVVEGNEIANSGGSGIAITGGGSHQVRSNELKDNGFGIVVGEELLGSDNNYVETNSVVGGGGGITVTDSSGTVVLENTVRDTTGSGVALELADYNIIRGNDVRANGDGISLEESSGNQVLSNNANDTLGTGISVGALSYSNDIIGNSASLNSGEGIAVDDAALTGRETHIENNTADGNGGDGIYLAAAGHVLKANSASLNGGWGMYAAVPIVDRGGNYAAGNVEPDQCYNVTCSTGVIPGAPEVWIVGKPPTLSHSRNASFTWNGRDDTLATHELVWECRLDTTDPLAWEDCEYPQEYFGLQPGQHTFEIRAVEPTGLAGAPARYTWTYAPLPTNDAPTTTIDIKPPLNTFLPDAIFTFHADEPDVTFECRVDVNGWEDCGFDTAAESSQGAFEWGLAETEVGAHTFQVRAIDFEGNVESPPASYTWNLNGIVTSFIDGPGFTPPPAPGEPATGGPTTSSTAMITFEANTADPTFLCSLDLEPFEPCTSPVTYTDLLEGDHLLRVLATDGDLTELEAAEYEWEVVNPGDSVPPETTLERAPANNSSSTTFEFFGTDNLTYGPRLTFECRVDGPDAAGAPITEVGWEACTSPFSLLDLYTYEEVQMAPGAHTFEVRAIDAADPLVPPDNPDFEGNVDPTPQRHTWTMVADIIPPGTAVAAGIPASIGPDTEALVEFYGADNATPDLLLEFQCSLSTMDAPGGTVVEPYAPCDVLELPDAAGLAIDVGGMNLEPGSYELAIRSVDLALNVDLSPAVEAFTLVPPPVTTFSSGPAGRVVDGGGFVSPSTSESAVFVFSASQPGSTFQCSLDGAPMRRCSSPAAFWVVASGQHEFEVQATNPEGVVEEPPSSYVWNVELGPDATAPDTRILSAPPAVVQNSVATFTFTGSDNRTTAATLSFECALDGSAFNSCTSPQQFSDLQTRSHTLLVRAKDAAGNFDPTPASYTWAVQAPPVTTISTGPAQETSSRTATFTFAADVPGATYQCWFLNDLEPFNGAPGAPITGPCTSPITYNDLKPGENLFAVLATANGISEEQWAEWEWTIGETVAPVTTITDAPDQTVEVSDPAVFAFESSAQGVEFTCDIGGTAVPCTSAKSYGGLEVGTYTFTVSAMHPPERWPLYDAPIESSYTFRVVDTEPPAAPVISYGPNDVMASPHATFGFSAAESGVIIECSLDFEGFNDCETPYVIEDLTQGVHRLDVRAVDGGGNVSPVVTRTWRHTPGAVNTAIGTNVTATLDMPGPRDGSATFFEVSAAGSTTVDVLTGGPGLIGGYGAPTYVDLHSTAGYQSPVRVCLPYDLEVAAGRAARILHYDGGEWLDVTSTNNLETGVVCAEVDSFSLFALAYGTGVHPLASITAAPENPSGSSTARFTFTADVPDARIQCSIDGEPFTACTSPVTYTHLEEGDHSFMVQALGQTGMPHPTAPPALFEWEILLTPDVNPPETVITGGPADGDLIGSYFMAFEFTGTDDRTLDIDLSFECRLDGVELGGCSSPEEIEVTTAGRHTFEVFAIDDAGLVDPTPAARTFTVVDVDAPDTSIELGPDSETPASVAVFEFLGEEPDGTPVTDFECSLDYADFTSCTTPWTIEGISVGNHVFEVRAKDLAGVVDSTPDIYEWIRTGTIDTVAPDTTIAAVPSDPSGPEVLFGFTSDEPVEEYECKLDTGPWGGCEATTELVGLASGQHTLQVRAIDLAESPNTDPTPASHTWNVVGEPTTTITAAPDAQSAARSSAFSFTSDQLGAEFLCSLDGSPAVPCVSPYIAGPLAQDTHTFEVYAVNQFRYLDGSRVQDQSPATREWTVQDLTGPETVIRSVVRLGPADLIEPDTIRFEITGTDNGTGTFDLEYECRLDGGPWEGCDAPYHYVPVLELASGEHLMEIRGIDEWDNVDPTPATHRFTTEQGPETTILTGPPAETESASATFTFSADPAAGARFQCSLDGAPFAACASGDTFTGIPWGEHLMRVRALSPGGVAAIEHAEYEWVSGDMTPPTVQILTGPAEFTADTTATFTFVADDPQALFQCSLDNGPLVFCDSGVTYTAEQLAGDRPDGATGLHTLEVTATKLHLLVEGVGAVWEWTVDDTTDPDTEILSGPEPAISLATAAVFRFASPREPAPTFECSLDGETFAGCGADPVTGVADLGTLPAGSYTLAVRAVDPSGNRDATPATYVFEVVGEAVTTIQSGPVDGSVTSARTATFAWDSDQPGVRYTCALDGAEPTICTSPVSFGQDTPLSLDGHTFSLVATNRFDAVSDPVTVDWTVVSEGDLEPPLTTIDQAAAPAPITPADHATFALAADQAGVTFRCSLDAAPFAGCTTPASYTDLAEGPHSFRVLATNAYGVTESVPAEHLWTVDYAPQTEFLTTPPAETLDTTAVFNVVSPGDGAAEFQCSLDEPGAWSSCPESVPGSMTFENLLPGEHTLQVRAVDVNGFQDQSPVSFSWTIVPPVETFLVTNPPIESPTAETSVTFELSSNKAGAIFECALDEALDGDAWAECDSTVTINDLEQGEHAFAARAVDADGNVDLTPVEFEWEIGGTPPVVDISSGPDVTTGSRSATFEFTADGNALDFRCQLDNGGWGGCTSPVTYSGLVFGAHTFEVRVLDPLAPDEAPISQQSWTVVKLTLPETSLDSTPGAVTGTGTDAAPVAFTFSSNEANATFECALDTEVFSECASPQVLTDLAVGDHDFRVRAVDVVGQHDTTPAVFGWRVAPAPETAITAGPEPDLISGAEATFEFSANLTGSTFECALNTGAWGTCVSPHTLTGLGDGEHTLFVRATSVDGVTDESPAEWSWTVGLVPQTTIESGPTNPTTSTGAVFRFRASEVGVTYWCSLDGVAFVQCDPAELADHFVSGLAAGTHTLQVAAQDGDGNRDASPASYTWRIVTPPATTIDSTPGVTTDARIAVFTFSSSDTTATFECKLGNADFAACTSPAAYADLALGNHRFEVRAVDADLFADETPATHVWTVTEPRDTTAPETSIAEKPAATTASTTAVFRYSASELGTFQCSLDDAPFTDCVTARTEYSNLGLGEHTFRVRATDASANTDQSPAEWTWTIVPGDTTPPTTTISTGPGATTPETTATFAFFAESDATYECSLDGAAFGPCTSPVTHTGLSVGAELSDHTFRVRATDLAGNLEPGGALYEWTIEDGVAPDTELTATPEPPYTNGNATFEFAGSDNAPAGELAFECRLDLAGEWTDCTSPATYVGENAFGAGEHTFQVRAVDQAGNVDGSPAESAWVVPVPPDTTDPAITLTGQPADGTTETSATFAFSANEDVTFACRVDEGDFEPCTSPTSITDLGVGAHSFSVRATDPAGNVATETRTWSVAALPDTTPPVVQFDSAPSGQTAQTTARFAWSANEDAAYKCRLDGVPDGSFNTCTSPETLTGLSEGEHTFAVQATDAAGNRTVIEYRWEVMAAPVTTIATAGAPTDPTDQTEATFTFSSDQDGSTFQCALDTEVFTDCTSPVTYSALINGDHEFQVVTTGPAGNADPTPATFSWSIGDITAPVVSILPGSSVADGVTTEATSASFEVAVDDPDATLVCQLDSRPEQDCGTSPKSYADLDLGQHTFTLRATKPHLYADVEPVTVTWTIVDTTAPDTTIASGPVAQIAEGTDARFVFTSSEPGATFECLLDGASVGCETPYLLAADAGQHTLEVAAVDASGNADPTPATRTWTVLGAPTTTVAGSVTGLTARFTFDADQGQATFECSLDGGGWTTCESPASFAVTPGSHTLEVRATSRFGIVGPESSADVSATAPAGYTPTGSNVSVDTGPATLTFTTVTGAGVTTATVLTTPPPLPASYLTAGALFYDLSTTVDHSGAVTVCVSYDTLNTPVQLLHHTDGAWVDVTTSSDPIAGVVCGTTTNLSPFAVVEVLPSTTIVDQPAASTADPSARFGFTSDNPAATFECAVDEADAWGSCSATEVVEDLAVGSHTLWVRARVGDRVDQSPADHTWTVRAPETTIESGPPARSAATLATFVFSSDAPGGEFECRLDGGTWGSCTSPYELQAGPGAHALDVRAQNSAGAVDASPADYAWTVKSAPETTITDSPTDPTDSRSATFAFEADAPGATFECSLDGSVFVECASPRTYANLVYESHDFAVRAVDADGDRDASPAEYSWEIGEIPPPVTIDAGPSGNTESRDATFRFSTTGSGWTFECQLDGSNWSECSSPQELRALALGSHTFAVRVFSPEAVTENDPATRTWRIADLTAPETRIDSGPRTPTNATTATFGLGSNEQTVTYECSLDGAEFTSCSDPAQLLDLAVGTHTLDVVAIDAEGNQDASPARYTWTVVDDTTGPEAQITAKPAARTEATAATFSFSSNEAGSTFECRLDAGAWESCSVPEVVENLALGSHTLAVRATDLVGNVGATTSYDWLVVADATEPQTTLGTTPAATTLERIAGFTFTSNEADVIFECRLDQGAWTECDSPAEYDVAVGAHTFAVRAVDVAGNVDQSPAEHAWTVLADTTAPETTIGDGPTGVTIQTTVTFGFSASEAGSTFACSIDGNGFSACTSPLQLTDVEPGTHTLQVRATDSAGNVDQSPASRTWTVAVRPETTLTGALPEDGEGRAATFTFAADPAAGATFECRLDGGAWASCTSPKTYTGVPVGERTVQVRGVSADGFADLSPAEHTWTVEPVSVPDTAIGSGPAPSTEDTTARFVFSSTETGGTFQCKLDQAPDWAACTSPRDLTGLSLDRHDFAVRAIDADGNIDASPATFSWTVVAPLDTVDPDTQITDGPPATTSDTSATIRFTVSDDRPGSVTSECKLDEGSWTSCTSPASFTGLALGLHTVQVRAVDTAGNVDESPVTRAWTVVAPADTTTPQTTISSGPADPTTSRSAVVAFTGTDDQTVAAALTYECRLDNGGWAACTTPASYQNVTDGLHTLEVRAVDAAGNKDASPAIHQWFVRQTQATNCGPALTLNATADAWVDQKSPTQNKGTDSILKVQSKSGSNNFRSMVRFTLPAAPASCLVSTATLRMFNASPKSGRTVQAIRLGAAWTESAVSWANQPAVAGPVATAPSASVAGWNQWTVTSQVQAMLAPGANHGFLIRDAVENQGSTEQQYHAREKGTEVPQLLVTFVPAPPDTTAPNTTLTGGPAAGSTTTARTATFALASDEPGSTFECALDGGPFTPCTSPVSYSALDAGVHRFSVRARDVSGNADATPVSLEWTISGP